MDESSGLRQRSQSSGHLGVSLSFEGTLRASFLEGLHFTESHLSWKSQRHTLWVKWNPISVVFILFFFFLPCIMGSVSVEEADTTGQGFSSKHFQWTHLFIWGFVTSISWPISFPWQEAKRPGLGSVPSEKNFKPQQARNLYREFASGLFPHLQAPRVCLSFSLLPLVWNERQG